MERLPALACGSNIRQPLDWQDTADYDRALKTPQTHLMESGEGCDADLYAEIKAIVGGATSTVGSLGPSKVDPHDDCIAGLARNLDFRSGLGFSLPPNDPCKPLDPAGSPELADVVDNEVFPLEKMHDRVDYLRCELQQGTTGLACSVGGEPDGFQRSPQISDVQGPRPHRTWTGHYPWYRTSL